MYQYDFQEKTYKYCCYMEYNGDFFRHYIRNYWHEVGTEFDDYGTKFVENATKYNPNVVIKYSS